MVRGPTEVRVFHLRGLMEKYDNKKYETKCIKVRNVTVGARTLVGQRAVPNSVPNCSAHSIAINCQTLLKIIKCSAKILINFRVVRGNFLKSRKVLTHKTEQMIILKRIFEK